jgi:hypothetical protein
MRHMSAACTTASISESCVLTKEVAFLSLDLYAPSKPRGSSRAPFFRRS